MQQVDFKRLASDFTTGQQIRSRGPDGGVTGFHFKLLLFLRAFVSGGLRGGTIVEHNGAQGFGCEFGGCSRRERSFHKLCVKLLRNTLVSSANRELGKRARRISFAPETYAL